VSTGRRRASAGRLVNDRLLEHSTATLTGRLWPY